MKTIATFSKTLLLFSLILTMSCSNDDKPVDDNTVIGTEEKHSYSLNFSGGELNDKSFSNSYLNNKVIPGKSEVEDDDGNLMDKITFSFKDKDSSKDVNLTCRLKKNGNQFLDFTPENGGGSELFVKVDNTELTSISGSVVITNYGEIATSSLGMVPHFNMTYTTLMTGTDSNGTLFTTEASGTISIKPTIF